MKKILLILMLILFAVNSAFASDWQMIYSSPSGGSFIDKEKIMYDKNTDTAKIWAKNEFLNHGCYILQEVTINYTNNTLAMSSPAYVYTLNNEFVKTIDGPDINRFFPIREGSSADATKKASLKYIDRK